MEGLERLGSVSGRLDAEPSIALVEVQGYACEARRRTAEHARAITDVLLGEQMFSGFASVPWVRAKAAITR